ncbi:MAG: hypothetical protein LLG14_00300 [Nocardiaceae bacterium]|nr:hypothetical protein [Nocardiaceae bacterium]
MNHTQWRAGARIALIVGTAAVAAVGGVAISSADEGLAKPADKEVAVSGAAEPDSALTNAMQKSTNFGKSATTVAMTGAKATHKVGTALSRTASTHVDKESPSSILEFAIRLVTNLLRRS